MGKNNAINTFHTFFLVVCVENGTTHACSRCLSLTAEHQSAQGSFLKENLASYFSAIRKFSQGITLPTEPKVAAHRKEIMWELGKVV